MQALVRGVLSLGGKRRQGWGLPVRRRRSSARRKWLRSQFGVPGRSFSLVVFTSRLWWIVVARTRWGGT
jgi:hypothetical protein